MAIGFLHPSHTGANGTRYSSQQSSNEPKKYEKKKALSQMRERCSFHRVHFKLRLLKNQKLVLRRWWCLLWMSCTDSISGTLPLEGRRPEAERALGLPPDANAPTLSASKVSTACLHVPNPTHFLAYFHLGNASVENSIQMPGAHNTHKHNTRKPNHAEIHHSFYSKNENI